MLVVEPREWPDSNGLVSGTSQNPEIGSFQVIVISECTIELEDEKRLQMIMFRISYPFQIYSYSAML